VARNFQLTDFFRKSPCKLKVSQKYQDSEFMKDIRFKISKLFEVLIGPADSVDLESRIFNGVALLSAVALLVNALINFVAGHLTIASGMLIIALLSLSEYYLCRVKQKLALALLLFGLIGNASFALIYLADSAIDGPGTYAFVLLLFLLIAIAPKKQYAFWMIMNPVLVTFLLLITYYYPDLVNNSYRTKSARFITIGYNYVFFTLMIGLITIYLKNTYRKQKILLEEKAELLKEVNETKNKLFSVIAHDMRSPLASIQNYLEVISEVEFSVEEKKKIERELLLKTKDTDQMLYNLLHWSSAQMDGIQVKLVTLNLKETVTPVLQIIRASAIEKSITLRDLLPGTIFLTADKDMLQLMVRNLVSNAVKFTQPGGEVKISHTIKNNFCRISISDNGVGIPPENRSTLFSLKTKSTYGTKQEKGTGLGLVLCKEFAELQNGTIGFESNHPQGTTFYFTMKIAEG
jgi:two-component system sensor histidine kinase/response regulator